MLSPNDYLANQRLCILGASARAAAASAVRAGYSVCAADLFADVDTAAMAKIVRIADYPHDFLAAASKLPDAPWMYTGGLENYPDLIDAIAAERPLWGNAGPVLRAVRDPLAWTSALEKAGLPTLPVARDAARVPRDGSWLAKPLRSGGGLGIQVVESDSAATAVQNSDIYYQERAHGMSASLVFVAAGRKSRLLGSTRQFSGAAWTGAPPFVYCGSLGPLSVPARFGGDWARIGEVFAAEFELTGLFGVDGIVNDEGFWTVEINPRYTASIEILERATGANFIRLHADASRHGLLPALRPTIDAAGRQHGKAILYAEHDTRCGATAAEWIAVVNAARGWPRVADIPKTGERFQTGDPLATLFAEAASAAAVLDELHSRCAALRSQLE